VEKRAVCCGDETTSGGDGGVGGGWGMEEIFDNGMQPTYITLNVL